MSRTTARSIVDTVLRTLKRKADVENVEYDEENENRIIGFAILDDQPRFHFAVNTVSGTAPEAWVAQGQIENHVQSDVPERVKADLRDTLVSTPEKPCTI